MSNDAGSSVGGVVISNRTSGAAGAGRRRPSNSHQRSCRQEHDDGSPDQSLVPSRRATREVSLSDRFVLHVVNLESRIADITKPER